MYLVIIKQNRVNDLQDFVVRVMPVHNTITVKIKDVVRENTNIGKLHFLNFTCNIIDIILIILLFS